MTEIFLAVMSAPITNFYKIQKEHDSFSFLNANAMKTHGLKSSRALLE